MRQQLIEWANNNFYIKVLLLVGSRAMQKEVDELSDYDICVFSDSVYSFVDDDRWLSQFGKVWICVPDHKEWQGNSIPTKLVIFEGGTKVDFSFWSTDCLKKWCQGDLMPIDFQVGFQVLFDKENLTQNFSKHRKLHISKPAKQIFVKVIQEFLFEAFHVSKYLKRNDLWSVQFRLGLLREFLLKMIEWNEQARHNWTILFHPNGKNLQTWVNSETLSSIEHIFAHFDRKDCFDSFKTTVKLFQRISVETAKMCGFVFPELDRKMIEYILKAQDFL